MTVSILGAESDTRTEIRHRQDELRRRRPNNIGRLLWAPVYGCTVYVRRRRPSYDKDGADYRRSSNRLRRLARGPFWRLHPRPSGGAGRRSLRAVCAPPPVAKLQSRQAEYSRTLVVQRFEGPSWPQASSSDPATNGGPLARPTMYERELSMPVPGASRQLLRFSLTA